MKVSEKYNGEIHIHLAETKGEVENCLKEYGKTPIALMEKVGIFRPWRISCSLCSFNR